MNLLLYKSLYQLLYFCTQLEKPLESSEGNLCDSESDGYNINLDGIHISPVYSSHTFFILSLHTIIKSAYIYQFKLYLSLYHILSSRVPHMNDIYMLPCPFFSTLFKQSIMYYLHIINVYSPSRNQIINVILGINHKIFVH